VTWKCLGRHPNIVPFLGIYSDLPVSMVSVWMPKGTISGFFLEKPRENRAPYVCHHLGVVPSAILTSTPDRADSSRARIYACLRRRSWRFETGSLMSRLNHVTIMSGHQVNILVDESQNARLVDFGMSTFLFKTSTQLANPDPKPGSVGGTVRYMAPELLSEECDGDALNFMTDIYALSITLWQVRSHGVISRTRD
jgi:serine/threonine protein kinase